MIPWTPTETSAIVNAPTDAISDLLYCLEQHRRALVSQVLVGHQMSFSQWLALKALWARGPCSMTELAKASVIDRTSLTRTVDSLIARGCVARAALPGDRRAVIVEVSAMGADLARRVSLDVQTIDQRMLCSLEADQQQRLALDLARLLQGLTASHIELASTDRSRLA
jgi:DNA-binding MarR family transcriptional regulator